MVTEDFVSFETAKLLKEKGFDWLESPFYSEQDRGEWQRNNNYTVPNEKYNPELPFDSETLTLVAPHVSLQMAMKWLREVHNIGIFPTTFYRHTETFDGHNYGCTLVNLKTFDVIGNFEDCTFPANSYEQTCERAIKYCLENLI